MPETRCGFNDSPDGKIKGADLLHAIGPSLAVDIGFGGGFAPGGIPKAAATGVWALVDTGASECCIDGKLATNLRLPIVDRQTIAGSKGAHDVDVHLAQIHVPALGFTIYGRIGAVDLAAGGQQHQALIGRSFLRHCTMIYSGSTGDVKLFS